MSAPVLAMLHWLERNQQPDGRIRDPVHGEYGTYADGFAGLAFALMAERSGDSRWHAACRRALDVARRRPVDSEFDQFALLLLALRALDAADEIDAAAWPSSLGAPSAAEIVLYGGRYLVSHNWVAMRAASYGLRARLNGSRTDSAQATELWRQILALQQPSGLFVDSPGGLAAPVTYHAKICAMAAVALRATETPIPELPDSLRRGLEALVALVSPEGVLTPYGRSRHTLFGYAAAILALRWGARLFGQTCYTMAAHRLQERVRHFQCPDGHVPCVLNDGEATRRDWDVYVNNPDYNAYCAVMLLLAEEEVTAPALRWADAAGAGERSRPEGRLGDGEMIVSHVGPILTVKTRDLFAALSTFGQSVPYGSPFFCDHRSYGMLPLWIEQGGGVIDPAAPYVWRGVEKERSMLVDPAGHDWIPYVEWHGRRYCVREYERVQVRQDRGIVEIEAEGAATAYASVPRWERGLRSALARSDAPSRIMRERVLAGVRLRRTLSLSPRWGMLAASTRILGELPRGATLRQAEHELRFGAGAGRLPLKGAAEGCRR